MIFLVTKNDGEVIFFVDYRRVNRVTRTEQWPIARIQNMLGKLSGSLWFSAIDLTSGCWQIAMDRDSKEISAFSTHNDIRLIIQYQSSKTAADIVSRSRLLRTLRLLLFSIALEISLHWPWRIFFKPVLPPLGFVTK